MKEELLKQLGNPLISQSQLAILSDELGGKGGFIKETAGICSLIALVLTGYLAGFGQLIMGVAQ